MTAKDWWVPQEIYRLSNPEDSSLESIDLVDDYTLTFNSKEPLNPFLTKASLDRPLWCPHWIYKEWVEKLRDASTQKKRDRIMAKLAEKRVPIEQVINKGLGNGPFKITHASNTDINLVRHEGHPLVNPEGGDGSNAYTDELNVGKDINIPKLTLKVASGSRKSQMMAQGRFDSSPENILPTDLRTVVPEYCQNISKFPSTRCYKFMINYHHPDLAERGVRRAIACAIDIPDIVKNFGSGFIPEVQTGMNGPMNENWLGKEFVDKLIKWPLKSDQEVATRYMHDAGYQKKNGFWMSKEGGPITIKLRSPTWSDWVVASKTLSEQLEDFGFKPQLYTSTSTVYYQQTSPKQMDFDMTMHYLGSHIMVAHPWLNYQPANNDGLLLAGTRPIKELVTMERSPVNNHPIVVTVPSELGAKEVTGDGMTYNLLKILPQLETSQSRENTVEIARKAARYWNYDLPAIVFQENAYGLWGDVQDWQWPEKGDPVVRTKWSSVFQLMTGRVRAVTEPQEY